MSEWKNKEKLKSLYWDENMSLREMGDYFGISANTVKYWMKKLGVERVKKNGARDRKYKDKNLMEELYINQNLSLEEVADELNASYNTIRKWVHKHGLEKEHTMSTKKCLKRPPEYGYNGEGYEYVANIFKGEKYRFLIHRLVAVAEYGYDDVSDSIVHHKNEVKWDNRPSNLEVMSQSEHAKLHKPVMGRWSDD